MSAGEGEKKTRKDGQEKEEKRTRCQNIKKRAGEIDRASECELKRALERDNGGEEEDANIQTLPKELNLALRAHHITTAALKQHPSLGKQGAKSQSSTECLAIRLKNTPEG